MSFLGFSKKKEEVIVVLDIGSASVGGMIIKAFPDQPERKPALSADRPQIITSARVPVNFLLDVNFEAFWRCTADALKKVVSRLLKDFPSRPDKVLCVFSSPWFVSQTRIITVKRKEPFEITKSFFEKLVNNEIKIFKSQWQSRSYGLSGEPELIEYDTMKTNLNGYQTKNPLGKKAKTFEAHIYMSMGVKKAKDEIKKIILENFGAVETSFHSLPIIVFNVLANIIKLESGYLFADVGGEVSDISLVRKNVLEETISFPRGRNSFVRKIAAKFKTSLKEADSLLERYHKERSSVSDSKKIALIAEEIKDEWRNFLGKALKEISENGPLPQDFFLLGGRTAGPEFIECAKDEPFSKFTILGKSFNVKQILPGGLNDYFKFKRDFEKDGDVFLMIESLFALWPKK